MSVYSLIVIKKVIYYLLKNRYIYIKYSNGVGNNLFQYNFCYLLSNKSNIKIINRFLLNKSMYSLRNRIISRFLFFLYDLLGQNNIFISKINNESKNIPRSFINIFSDTGEVLEAFQGKESILRNNFLNNNSPFLLFNKEKQNNKNYRNLVIHLRLGDRLVRASDYQPGMFYDFKKLQDLVKQEIKENNKKLVLSIVTDTPNIMHIKTIDDFNNLKSHTYVCKKNRISPLKGLKYIYKIQEFIYKNEINIVSSQSLAKDFSLMFNSDILIFLHGTLSWWAGYLGYQDKVYVSKLWRPQKASNPFLSRYKSKNWIKW